MAALVFIWGARLTFNFSRRGGYALLPWKGEEDYRWDVLRQQINNRGVFVVFNLLFICFYQLGLLLMFVSPILSSWVPFGRNDIREVDCLLAAVIIGLVVFETVAD
jgi:steroid 5-alpha reductase family enzyme